MPVFRVGEGHDLHRTIEGRPLILGGIRIECHFGLDGHSDADVLLHAVTDAVLGATAQGDIGEWFPNTDERWKNADSRQLLKHVWKHVTSEGWQLVNLDCTITAEQPRLTAWKSAIRDSLCGLFEAGSDQINVKAKSGERVGPVGRLEAISADAVVLLSKTPKN
ncbi:MAG: 2-C-methyl-D-erythritol 2,4-cyclodiphosphate synthase [Planctomycetaceae bacterium]|nr:2-C-methyl-D-erythritol 2,4-cyclodiphosphate synthase [Planctomycetaceae bacterium]